FPEESPREQPDEDDLRVAENRGQARPDLLDRVVPEDQVGGKECACQPRRAAKLLRPGPEPAVLPDHERPAERHGAEAAERGTRPGSVSRSDTSRENRSVCSRAKS